MDKRPRYLYYHLQGGHISTLAGLSCCNLFHLELAHQLFIGKGQGLQPHLHSGHLSLGPLKHS